MKTDKQMDCRHKECLVQDMIPGHCYCSEDIDQDIILPLDIDGNVVVFTKGGIRRYHDICMKTTCDKWGISKVRELEECHLAWVKVWNTEWDYTLTALPPDSKSPKPNEMILNWEEALTALNSHCQILYLSNLCLLSIQYGCIHLEWRDYANGGAISELGKAGYLKEWYIPNESKYWLPHNF